MLAKRTQSSGDHRGHGDHDEEGRAKEQCHHRCGYAGVAPGALRLKASARVDRYSLIPQATCGSGRRAIFLAQNVEPVCDFFWADQPHVTLRPTKEN